MTNLIRQSSNIPRSFSRAATGLAAVTNIAALIWVLNGPAAGAQSQPAPPASAAFEVASIKPGKPGASGSSNLFGMSGRFTAENSTLKSLIQFAYQVRAFQVLGGPSWLDRDTYDIVAKPEARVAGGKQNLQMVQTLLADRFQLKFHRETRELPVYLLVVAKSGPRLHEAENPLHGIAGRPRSIESKGADMQALAATLARRLGYTVIDKTGLTGSYDFTLTFDPNAGLAMSPGGESLPAAESGDPSIFTALQEQLGLKLESSKGPVEVIVIDRAEKPSEN
jgi:uncharacterized protein (TIGR03435 family)